MDEVASDQQQQSSLEANTTNSNSSTPPNDDLSTNNNSNKQLTSEEPQDKANNDNKSSNNEHLPNKRNPIEDLFSTKKWGVTPIRQDVPWALPPSPTSTSTTAPTGPIGAGQLAPNIPPGISQSDDSFRSSTSSVGDFHGQSAMVNNFGVEGMSANGLANSLGHMNLRGAGVLHSSRFDQPWRAPASKPHQAASMTGSSPFANHNLINPAPGTMQKSILSSNSGNGSSFVGLQQASEFARAPGPASSIMDNSMAPKPYGMTQRASTWSSSGTPAPNESEAEWPKTSTTAGGISGNSTQPSNAFDLVEFEPGKPWRGSMLMKSVEDDPTMTPGSMSRSLAPLRKTIWSDEIL